MTAGMVPCTHSFSFWFFEARSCYVAQAALSSQRFSNLILQSAGVTGMQPHGCSTSSFSLNSVLSLESTACSFWLLFPGWTVWKTLAKQPHVESFLLFISVLFPIFIIVWHPNFSQGLTFMETLQDFNLFFTKRSSAFHINICNT